MDNIIIYNTDDGAASVKLYANDGTVWLARAEIASLFQKDRSTISKHIKNIFAEGELDEKNNVHFLHIDNSKKPVAFYSLDVILAVGFRVRSPRGTQFRRWANTTLKEYLQKGFVIDDERLKNPDGRPDYFDELLARIRDIRASEKRFYQKLRDLFALSSDYDKTDHATQLFFAEVQNKLIYGVTGQTAADEIDTLNRLVTIFLESAELRVKMRKDLTLSYWRSTVDKLLEDHGVPVLTNRGSHSHDEMVRYVTDTYTQFDARRKKADAQQADADDFAELEREIPQIKGRKQ